MIPNAWRTDHDGWDPDDRPSPSDLAHEPTGGPGLDAGERLTLVADVAQIQRNARRNWYPVTRCDTWDCHTTVNLHDDPMALCDTCGLVTCDHCHHTCTGDAA